MKLDEVELIPDYDPAQRHKDPIVKGKGSVAHKEIKTGEANKIGSYMGHTFYVGDDTESWGDVDTKFFAVNDQTGLPVMLVNGKMSRKKGGWLIFKINVLQGREGSTLKAHEFYRFLMMKYPMIMVTDAQSYGGLKVWQKLSADPRLTVFGWKNGKAVNVDPRDDTETHATDDEAWEDPESRDVIGIKLVAHRKIK